MQRDFVRMFSKKHSGKPSGVNIASLRHSQKKKKKLYDFILKVKEVKSFRDSVKSTGQSCTSVF